MNRQERRKKRKLAETEARNFNILCERQNRLDDKLMELWMVCTALAVADVYGEDCDETVGQIMTAFQERLKQLNERPLVDLCKELSERTGIEFVWNL